MGNLKISLKTLALPPYDSMLKWQKFKFKNLYLKLATIDRQLGNVSIYLNGMLILLNFVRKKIRYASGTKSLPEGRMEWKSKGRKKREQKVIGIFDL